MGSKIVPLKEGDSLRLIGKTSFGRRLNEKHGEYWTVEEIHVGKKCVQCPGQPLHVKVLVVSGDNKRKWWVDLLEDKVFEVQSYDEQR